MVVGHDLILCATLEIPLNTTHRSSFSETLGRRTIYIISFALFIVFSALSAISTNIGMLIAMRILAGGASASVQAVGAGTIADIWMVFERGKAMSMLSCRDFPRACNDWPTDLAL